MSAALLAPLAVAEGSLVVRTDVCGAVSYFQRLRLPQRKRVDRSRGPLAAGFAMTIPHRGRLTRHLELDLAAKAATFVNFSIAHAPTPRSLLWDLDSIPDECPPGHTQLNCRIEQ